MTVYNEEYFPINLEQRVISIEKKGFHSQEVRRCSILRRKGVQEIGIPLNLCVLVLSTKRLHYADYHLVVTWAVNTCDAKTGGMKSCFGVPFEQILVG